jgi:hypothetical protein
MARDRDTRSGAPQDLSLKKVAYMWLNLLVRRDAKRPQGSAFVRRQNKFRMVLNFIELVRLILKTLA